MQLLVGSAWPQPASGTESAMLCSCFEVSSYNAAVIHRALQREKLIISGSSWQELSLAESKTSKVFCSKTWKALKTASFHECAEITREMREVTLRLRRGVDLDLRGQTQYDYIRVRSHEAA